MRLFRNLELPNEYKHTVIAIGNFDGVHLGHCSVIQKALDIGTKQKKKVGVLTFEPHPKCYFKNDFKFFRITPFKQKMQILKTMGLEFVINLGFNSEFVKITADCFLEDILSNKLQVSKVVTGYDFVFGNKQKGDTNLIKKFVGLTKNFEFFEVTKFELNSQEISSSAIRIFLRTGQLEKANTYLSRDWLIESRVVRGEQKAREIGYRTANFQIFKFCNLLYGVYKVSLKIDGFEKVFFGIANYGVKPTFNKTEPILEVHIFDFEKDIYGKKVKIYFKYFLRNEKKFESVKKLKMQIKQDIKMIKNENE